MLTLDFIPSQSLSEETREKKIVFPEQRVAIDLALGVLRILISLNHAGFLK
jgi:hypothetical protein